MNLFGYEWKKMIPKKGLLFIPLLYIYLFIDFGFVSSDDIWIEWFISYNFDFKILCVILIFILSPLFAREKESDMLDLILTSKNGVKELPKIKLLTGFVLTNILVILFCVISYISFGIGHSAWNWNVQIEDMALYRFISNPAIVTYRDMRNQVWLNSFFALNLLAAFVMLVSGKAKGSLHVAIISMVVNFVLGARNMIAIMRTRFGAMLIESFPANFIWNEALNEESVLLMGREIHIIYIAQVVVAILCLVLYKLISMVYKK